MARTLLDRMSEWWHGKALGMAAADRPKFVPHAEWSVWLNEGRWDRAAVLLQELRKTKKDDQAIVRLLPEWERRLTDSFLKAGWADLNASTALRWLRRVDRFPDRGIRDPSLDRFRDVAEHLWDADTARHTGDCRAALGHLDAVLQAMKEEGHDTTAFDELRARVAEDHEILLQLVIALRIHEDEGRPVDAASIARRILAIAPRHRGALTATKRLGAFELASTRFEHGGGLTDWLGVGPKPAPHVHDQEPIANSAPIDRSAPSQRSVVLGQISLDRADTWLVSHVDKLTIAPSDDPRFADLFGDADETVTVTLERDSEGCWLFTTDSGIQVDGKVLRTGCLLDGSVVRLTPSAPEWRFVQPRMETGTARLERCGRASPKGVKGLVLLGELFALGGLKGEIPHPEIKEPLVLADRGGHWAARRTGAWTLEAEEVGGEAVLQPPCRMRIGPVGIFWES